jgi:sec-independent protein translocase protein TatC
MSADDDSLNEGVNKEQSLLEHLIELRDRLLHMVLAVLVLFLVLFPFSEEIFTVVAEPLLALMPEGTSMIATSVTSPFLVPFKLVLLLAVLLAVPYLLHQLWAFVAPGLYSHEKRLAAPLLISSVLLFYLGIAFAYFVVFPLLFAFFIAIAPEGVEVMTDISQYLDFIIAIFFAFGIAFEVPVATFLLILAGATTPEKMAKKRPYIIVGAFVVGMMLTPPDVISQSLLAVPMWALFEVGLIMSRIFIKPKEMDESDPEFQFHDDDNPDEADMDAMMDKMEAEEEENLQRPD